MHTHTSVMTACSRARAFVENMVDGRAVIAVLGLALMASCSTERQSSSASPLLGVYRQIDRVGRPGVKEIFESFADHESSNRSAPSSDPALSAAIENYVGPLVNGNAAAIAAIRDTFNPDALQANLDDGSTTAGYLGLEVSSVGNTFGGRGITDPAMQLNLQLTYSSTLDGNIPAVPCLQTDNTTGPATAAAASFPYLTNS